MHRPIRPPTKRIRVARYARNFGHAPVTWRRAIRAIDWDREAKLIKSGQDATVWRVPIRLPSNMTVGVVKCQRLTVRRRVQSLLRVSKAHRQWGGAHRLLKAGIPAARPWVILQTKGRSKPIETLVLQNLQGPSLLEYIAREHATLLDTRRVDRAVIAAVARLLRRMQRARLYNRDGKPSNLILIKLKTAPGQEAAELAVVDTVAIERRRWTRELLVSALADLYVEPFGCLCAPTNRACLRLLRELAPQASKKKRHRLFRDVRREVLGRGDPTPKDNPLEFIENDPDRPPIIARGGAEGGISLVGLSGAELREHGVSIASARARAAQAARTPRPSPSAVSPPASEPEARAPESAPRGHVPPDPEPIPLVGESEEPKPMREPIRHRTDLDELLKDQAEEQPTPAPERRSKERSIDDILEELGDADDQR